MKLLLDTHIFLWHISNDLRLPPLIRAAIQDPANEVYLSVASVWEAVIEHGIGKLPLPAPPEEYLPRQRELHNILSLPIDEAAVNHWRSCHCCIAIRSIGLSSRRHCNSI